MLFLAIAVLPHRVGCCSDKDDAVAAFLPPSSSYTLHHVMGLYFQNRQNRVPAIAPSKPANHWLTTRNRPVNAVSIGKIDTPKTPCRALEKAG